MHPSNPFSSQEPASKNTSGPLRVPLPNEPSPLLCIDVEINGHPITALASMANENSIISLELAEQLSLPIESREFKHPVRLLNGTIAKGDGTVQVAITRRDHEQHGYLPGLQKCDVLPGSIYPLVLGQTSLLFYLQAVPYWREWYRLLSPDPPPEFDFKIRMSLPRPPLGDRTVFISAVGHLAFDDLGGDLAGDNVPFVLDGASTCCIISGNYARFRGMDMEELPPGEAYTLVFIDGSTAECSMVVRGVEWTPWDNPGAGYIIRGRTCFVDFLVVEECPAMVILGSNYLDAFGILKGPEKVPDLESFQITSLGFAPSLEQYPEISWLSKGMRPGVKVGDTWLEAELQVGVAMVERGAESGLDSKAASEKQAVQDIGQ